MLQLRLRSRRVQPRGRLGIFERRLGIGGSNGLRCSREPERVGSFFWAKRAAHGYSWGCLDPNEAGFNGVIADGNVDFTNLNRYSASPNIPDTELGYDLDLGVNWKLLEGWTAGVVIAYWQPGKWFSYACIDRSVPGWDAGTAGNNFGARPNRTIDPVIGGEFNMLVGF